MEGVTVGSIAMRSLGCPGLMSAFTSAFSNSAVYGAVISASCFSGSVALSAVSFGRLFRQTLIGLSCLPVLSSCQS